MTSIREPRSYNHITPLPTPLPLPLRARVLAQPERWKLGGLEAAEGQQSSSQRRQAGYARLGVVHSSLPLTRARNGTWPQRTIRPHHRISNPRPVFSTTKQESMVKTKTYAFCEQTAGRRPRSSPFEERVSHPGLSAPQEDWRAWAVQTQRAPSLRARHDLRLFAALGQYYQQQTRWRRDLIPPRIRALQRRDYSLLRAVQRHL